MLHSRRARAALACVALAALSTVAALAVAQGRLFGTVKDHAGQPLAGVKVTVTLEGVDSFKLEETTDAKGDYAITLIDATRVYTYTFSKEGYQTFRQELKIPIGANERHDFQLLSLEEASKRAPAGDRELTPKDKAILAFNAGAEAVQMGDTTTARAKFQEALGLDPSLAVAHSALATLAYNEGDMAKAIEHGEAAYAQEPQNMRVLRVLAEAYQKQGDKAKAKQMTDAIAALDPKAGAGDLYNDGVREYNAGNAAAAAAIFEKVLAADPGQTKAHYMLGLCLASTDTAKAREHLQKFIELAPSDPDAATAKEMLQYLK
jgi:tetratricopeptide (TPR) repeat protein